MSRRLSDRDLANLHQLISAVMDGRGSEDQRHELSQRLRSSAEARDEYLKLADLHAALTTDVTLRSSETETSTLPLMDSTADAGWSRRRHRTLIASCAALAASVLLVFCLWIGDGGAPVVDDANQFAVSEPVSGFATIAQVTNAIWKTDPMDVGSRLSATAVLLESGFVQIEYDSGVELTLEGPAKFELIDATQSNLTGGLLTATVPEGAEGFTVHTPTAEVVDLGTSFGIDLREEGFSNVSVFDGEVEVTALDASETRLLVEGESVRVGMSDVMEDIGFDSEAFERLWPIASGIVGSSRSIRFVPPWPRDIRLVESDRHVFVANEARRVALTAPLPVNVSQPGQYATLSDLTPQSVSTGSKIRSYILHFSPTERGRPRRSRRVTGSITFDRPVLGLIVQGDELLTSGRRLRRRGVGEASPRRELQLSGNSDGDRVSLSDDRRTVSVDLVSRGHASDLVRVIVDDEGRWKRSGDSRDRQWRKAMSTRRKSQ
ncbi:MAG: FecR domain-containing protein [Planctomycetota bacterium]